MSDGFSIKRNDRLPVLDIYLKNPDGTAYNLTGATVKLLMAVPATGVLKVNAAMTVIGDPTLGRVQYAWGATDTDTAGSFVAEVEVTSAGGLKQTFPTEDYFYVNVVSDLG